MRILILGGTGAIGRHIVELLCVNNLLYVTSRCQHDSSEGVTYILGNPHDIEFLKNILTDSKYDAIIDFMSYSTEEFAQRMQFMLDATDQYLFLSSSRVYADSSDAIKESSVRLLDICTDKQYINTDEYALRKARQENMLSQSGCRNWTILRPYITYSSMRLQLGVYEKEQWLFRALHGKPIVFSEDIASKFTTLTFGKDIAMIMAKLIGNKNAFGEVFHITGEQTVLWKNILRIYQEVLKRKTGKEIKVFMTPRAITPRESQYQYQYDRLYNRRFDNTKVLNAINKSWNFVSIEDGLKECIEEFIDNSLKFRMINYETEAMLDKACKCQTKVTKIPGAKNKVKYLLYRYL